MSILEEEYNYNAYYFLPSCQQMLPDYTVLRWNPQNIGSVPLASQNQWHKPLQGRTAHTGWAILEGSLLLQWQYLTEKSAGWSNAIEKITVTLCGFWSYFTYNIVFLRKKLQEVSTLKNKGDFILNPKIKEPGGLTQNTVVPRVYRSPCHAWYVGISVRYTYVCHIRWYYPQGSLLY